MHEEWEGSKKAQRLSNEKGNNGRNMDEEGEGSKKMEESGDSCQENTRARISNIGEELCRKIYKF